MSRTIHVSTREELFAALRSATGGETILLAGGDYGVISTNPPHHADRFVFQYPEAVTIASADPAAPAVFRDLFVMQASNLIFDGIHFDYRFDPAQGFGSPCQIRESHNITIRNSIFDGDVAWGLGPLENGLPFGQGMSIRNSSNIVVESSEFFNFTVGLGVLDSRNVSILENEFHSMRRDGLNIGRHNDGILIEGNHFHNFLNADANADHPDFIQFWTVDSTISPTQNVIIRRNVLDSGANSETQSIFMRNERVDMGRAGEEMFYRNILIEENIIYNGHLHGITVGESDGLVIRNNVMLFVSPDHPLGTEVHPSSMPRINVREASKNVTIENNVTFAVSGWSGQTDWNVQGNVFLQVQNPLAEGYYGDVFVSSSLSLGPDDRHSFIALPGGALDRPELGVAALLPADGSVLAGHFNVRQDADNLAVRVFDASVGAAALPEGAQFLWSFGDGITATGPVVRHPFPEGGRHNVALQVEFPDGRVVETGVQVPVAGSQVLSLGSDGVRSFSYGQELPAVVGDFPDGVAIAATGVALQLPRASLNPLFMAESFEIAFSIAPAQPGASGAVFRLHGSFAASVTAAGELRFDMGTLGGGAIAVQTSGARLHDAGGRDIRIRFEDGILQVFSNDVLVGQTVSEPARLSPAITGHTLVFGDPFGRANFVGQLTAFDISIDMADYAEARVLWEEARARMEAEPVPGAPEPTPAEPDPGVPEPPVESDPVEPDPPGEPPQDETPPPGGDAGGEEPDPLGAGPAEPDDGEDEGETPPPGAMPAPDPLEPPAEPEDDPGPILPPPPEEEDHGAVPGVPVMPLQDGFVLDPALHLARLRFFDNAQLVQDGDGFGIRLDGDRDAVQVGRLQEFEASQRIGFSVEFTRDVAEGSGGALVWHANWMGLVIQEDSFRVQVGWGQTQRSFTIEDPGLAAGVRGRVTVLADAQQDRLQVIVDDRLVLDETATDLSFARPRGWDFGWSLGAASGGWFAGEIHDFRVSDRFDFLDRFAPHDPFG